MAFQILWTGLLHANMLQKQLPPKKGLSTSAIASWFEKFIFLQHAIQADKNASSQQWLTYKTKLIFKILQKCDPTYSHSVSIPSFYENVAINLLHCKSEIYFYFFSYIQDGGIAPKKNNSLSGTTFMQTLNFIRCQTST